MKIEPKAFLAIENSMAAAMHGEWDKIASGIVAQLAPQIAAGQWADAQSTANRLSMVGVVQSVRPKLEELATSALLFGAHRASGDARNTIYAKGAPLPAQLQTVLDQLTHHVEQDAAEYIRAAVHRIIDDMMRADAGAHPQKYDENEPRVPAGSAGGGQWTAGGSNGTGNAGAAGLRPAAGAAEEGLRGGGGLFGGAGQLAAPGRPDLSTPLRGLPTKVKLDGKALDIGPYAAARQAAFDYAKEAGLDYHPPTEYAKVDPDRATRIAAEYDKMKYDPDDPEVKAAYGAMIHECMGQWKAAMKTGLKVEFIPPGAPDPYAKSPRLMTEDVRQNNHMWVYPTNSGFGTDSSFDASHNPLLGDAGIEIGGHKLVYNDVFRIVHDFFGHVKEGNGFRADGEENAWRSHMAMFSPMARRALTSETRGQNSWVNYGPFGAVNRTADAAQTHFADQKVGLMPEWTAKEGTGLPDDPTLKKWDPDEARDAHGKWTASEVHPARDDNGKAVTIWKPHTATDYAAIGDSSRPVVFTPGKPLHGALNGVEFKPWNDHPDRAEDWIHVEGQSKALSEPFRATEGKSIGSGVVIVEPDGRIWLTAPTNQYGGYKATWPKGTVEHGLNLQGSAIKEAYEETGLKVKLTGVLGDVERDTSKARFFLAKRVGGTPERMGWESQAAHLVTFEQAKKLLHRSHDRAILKAAMAYLHPDKQGDLLKDDVSVTQLTARGGLQEAEQGEVTLRNKKRRVTRQRVTKTEGPKTLYVHRKLQNAGDLLARAKAQGFKFGQKPDDMHVTLCYSKAPFDWDHLEPKDNAVTVAAGPRAIHQFGDAVVLELDSPELTQDHQDFRSEGASYDFPSYRPHVTITWEGAPKPVAQIEPYAGPLTFGPQVFKPINKDWQVDHEEVRLNKTDWDLIGKLNKAVKEGGKVAASLGAQLTTSRLISLGFLAQAATQGYDLYQIDEVLDEKTCPVCQYMNGKTFKVAQQKNRLTQALSCTDPAELKVLAPWPSMADLDDLYGMDADQLQAEGLGAPPFHPNCRGMLAIAGTVEETIPLGGPDMDGVNGVIEAASDQNTDAIYKPVEPANDESDGAKTQETFDFTIDDRPLFAEPPEIEEDDELPEVNTKIALPDARIDDGEWTADQVAALAWKRFKVTDPSVFARVDEAYETGQYGKANALIDGFLGTAKKEDEFDGPYAPRKKRKLRVLAGRTME